MHKKCEQILKELESEGKIKVWWGYTFPEEIELTKKLKDMLENKVDEKYYLSDEKITKIQNSNFMAVVTKNKRLNSLINKTNFEEGKVLNMDLYNQTTNENISQCLTEPHHNTQRLFDGYRIRKLTPKECWRLMRI